MLIALTGTPGTGKSTVAAILQTRGNKVLSVNELAESMGCMRGTDERRRSIEVDTDCLSRIDLSAYPSGSIFEGHLAHYLSVDLLIVLRTSPNLLKKRLSERGWGPEKIRENMEAEACDVILLEALDLNREVYEVDTTEKSPESAAADVERIMAGQTEDYLPGKTDWSEEVLSWY